MDRRYAASNATAITARPMTPESRKVSYTTSRPDARYHVPRRWLPASCTGRNPIHSPPSKRYPANPADVSSRTSPLITTSIAVSFCLIGQSRSDMSTPGGGDHLGHPQQLRADCQVRRFRRLWVDLQPDTAPVSHEANHASPFDESFGVAHGEDRPVLETRESL